MNNDIVHGVDEFSSCPFEKFTEENKGKWSWSKRPYSWALVWVHEDLHSEEWIMPQAIGIMLERHAEAAVNDRLFQIRRLLEI